MQGEGEGDEGSALPGDFPGSYRVKRSGALRLGALEKRDDGHDDEYHARCQQQRFERGQVALSGAELVTDLDRGAALRAWWSSVRRRARRGRRSGSRIGRLIRHEMLRTFGLYS